MKARAEGGWYDGRQFDVAAETYAITVYDPGRKSLGRYVLAPGTLRLVWRGEERSTGNRIGSLTLKGNRGPAGGYFGEGVVIDADEVVATDNEGIGLYFEGQQRSVLEQIGIPADTSPHELAELLAALRDQSQSAEAKTEVVRTSSLWSRIGKVSDLTTISSALVQLALSPAGQQLIQRFVGG